MNITVKGNVGSEPELKFSKNNMAYITLSVAYTPRVKDGDNWKDGETMWFRVVQFGTKAEATADMIKKGDAVLDHIAPTVSISNPPKMSNNVINGNQHNKYCNGSYALSALCEFHVQTPI